MMLMSALFADGVFTVTMVNVQFQLSYLFVQRGRAASGKLQGS